MLTLSLKTDWLSMKKTLRFLEILQSSEFFSQTSGMLRNANYDFTTGIFQDISLNQWLALTPPELVKAHLGLDDATIAQLSKVEQYVVG